MKLIAINDDVISFLSNEESLISGKISNISIQHKPSGLCIGLNIILMYSKENKKIFLEFESIKEYAFFYTSDRYFYNIERYTFFKDGNLFYISFDPANEQETSRDENDNDFILAGRMSLYKNF